MFFKKKNPLQKLEKKHKALLEEATNLQRNGDIKGFAKKMDEAEQIAKQIEELDK